MKNYLKIILIFGMVIFYIISINIFASLISYSYVPPVNKMIQGGSIVELNMGSSTGISVTRAPKWYGRFNEQNGEKYLNFLYFCNLPIKIKSYNFIYFHLIFLITIILLSVLMFSKKNYKEVQNGRLKEHLRGNKKTQK